MRQRIIVSIILLAVTAGLFTACGDRGQVIASKPDPITFTFYNADGQEDPWADPVALAITEATGVTLKTDYPVDGGNSKIHLMIASGEYPDLIFAKGDGTTLIEKGVLLDLTDLIEAYGPNIKKLYGDNYSRLRNSPEDPGIYQLNGNTVGNTVFDTAGSAQLQWAVLKYNNYEIPYTLAEYERQIKAYLEAYPTINGKPTLGLSISCSDWRWYITLANPSGYINGFPDNGQWIVYDDNNYETSYKHAAEGQYEYFQWLNRMYEEGVLDPEFATQRNEDYMAKISEGRVLGLLDSKWNYDTAESKLKTSGEFERTYAGLPVTMDASIPCAALYDQGMLAGWGIGITKSCKDPVRAIQFLDWMCTEEAQILINWGIQGINYLLDEDGKRYVPAEEQQQKDSDVNYITRTGVGLHTYPFPRYGDGVKDSNGEYFSLNNKETIIANYNVEEKAALEAWNVEMLIDIFPQADSFGGISPYGAVYQWTKTSEVLELEAALDAITVTELINVIICGQDNFTERWVEYQRKLEKAGLERANRLMTEQVRQRVEFWAD